MWPALGLTQPLPPLEVMNFSRSMGLFLPVPWPSIKAAKGKSGKSEYWPLREDICYKTRVSKYLNLWGFV